MSKKILFISFVVSLGGFLFGFDAGIISGVMSYAGPEFNLDDIQSGWVVSSPSFAAMIAMLFSGKLSDLVGRKKILLIVAFLYALSALLSAVATSYEMPDYQSNKGNALQFLQKELSISKNETLVIGDYLNDLELFENASVGFAVKNAHPKIKEIAQYETESNDNLGVERVLKAVLDSKLHSEG